MPEMWYGYLNEDHTIRGFDSLVDDELARRRWTSQFDDIDARRVGDYYVNGIRISTVFLGMNHGYKGDLWFETMVFGGKHDDFQNRCATWDEAVEMHEVTVRMVRSSEGIQQARKSGSAS